MRAWAVVLRLLLCLVLVANGATAAFANARMVFDGEAAERSTATHDADLPCHDAAPASTVADQDTPDTPSRDACCAPGQCLSNCLAHASALLTVQSPSVAKPIDNAPIPLRLRSHASPALQHPIRPPIG